MPLVPATRNQALESLRGLAAVAVVIAHLLIAFTNPGETGRPDGFESMFGAGLAVDVLIRPAKDGLFAVMVFFTLSGVVLSQSYLTHGRFADLTGGLFRRYPRLALPAAVSAILSCALWQAGWMHNSAAAASLADAGIDTEVLGSFSQPSPSFSGAVRQSAVDVFFSPVSPPGPIMYNPVLWTMRTELWGSILVFAFLGLVGHRPQVGWLAAAMALVFAAFGQMQLAMFPAGTALAAWRRDRPDWNWPFGLVAVVAILAYGLCGWYGRGDFVSTMYWPGGPEYEWPEQVTGLAAIMTVSLVLFSPGLASALQIRPLIWLGRVSFGLYLVHLLLILSLGSFVIDRALPHVGPVGGFALASCAVFAASIPLAWAMTVFVDRPAVWIGRGIAQLVNRP